MNDQAAQKLISDAGELVQCNTVLFHYLFVCLIRYHLQLHRKKIIRQKVLVAELNRQVAALKEVAVQEFVRNATVNASTLSYDFHLLDYDIEHVVRVSCGPSLRLRLFCFLTGSLIKGRLKKAALVFSVIICCWNRFYCLPSRVLKLSNSFTQAGLRKQMPRKLLYITEINGSPENYVHRWRNRLSFDQLDMYWTQAKRKHFSSTKNVNEICKRIFTIHNWSPLSLSLFLSLSPLISLPGYSHDVSWTGSRKLSNYWNSRR